MSRNFNNFVAIDWSGQAVERPKGLAVALAGKGNAPPSLLNGGKGWSRLELRDWLLQLRDDEIDVLIGVDLSPSFPFVDRQSFFPGWKDSPANARELWSLVDTICDRDTHLSATSFVMHAYATRHFRHQHGVGDLFPAGAGRFRVCEHRQREMGLSPYSCLNLIGAAQVGKSSLTGMRVLQQLGGRIPIWPFDPLPPSGPVIVEIYTALPARAAALRKGRSKIRDAEALDTALTAFDSLPHAPLARYDDHSTDAILTAAWLRANAHRPELWSPAALTPEIASTEGWTFGVT